MNKVIWTCWLQGLDQAPAVVQDCISSWEGHNPGWEIRVLDQSSIHEYLTLPSLQGKQITRTSFSDLLRLLLLAEYGGIWVDATALCNQGLDNWLPNLLHQSFFAFERPTEDRPVASWFLANSGDSYIVDRWGQATLAYWERHNEAHSYFWFHELFEECCATDARFLREWAQVPKRAAIHALRPMENDLLRTDLTAAEKTYDPETPVFKLSCKFDLARYQPGTLMWHLVEQSVSRQPREQRRVARAARKTVAPEGQNPGWLARLSSWFTKSPPAAGGEANLALFASLEVATQNLGDHIQILAGLALLRGFGIEPTARIDRDDDIATVENIEGDERIGLLLNGWFKTNRDQWPPAERIVPLFLGFHIRLFQCPELLAEPAILYYKKFGPIGCRDSHTQNLLEQRGVESFVSRCLSLTLPRRLAHGPDQKTVFVASRDKRILEILPESLGDVVYVNHYSESRDFATNCDRATEMLERYRSEASLIVTTFLHAALPAIAMGIPVVVFYPLNSPEMSVSDRERFTALDGLVPVHDLGDIEDVDWNPQPPDVSLIKLELRDRLREMKTRWPTPTSPGLPGLVFSDQAVPETP